LVTFSSKEKVTKGLIINALCQVNKIIVCGLTLIELKEKKQLVLDRKNLNI